MGCKNIPLEEEKEVEELEGTDGPWYDLIKDPKYAYVYDKWMRFFRDTTDEVARSILFQVKKKGLVSKNQFDYMEWAMSHAMKKPYTTDEYRRTR